MGNGLTPGDVKRATLKGGLTVLLSAAAQASPAETLRDQVEELLAKSHVGGRARIVTPGEELRRAVRDTVDRGGTVVVGGGDGSINCAAGVLADSGSPLGILPLGTFNHFAKDLGLPLELKASLEVVLAGYTTLVDAADVNGHVFVNNSSVGLYPKIVRLRERYQARGSRKLVAFAWATLKVVGNQPRIAVRLIVDGEPQVYRTSLIMIGNNEYEMAGLDATSRKSLTSGRLSVHVVKARRPAELARLVWRTLRGRPTEGNLLDVLQTTETTLELRRAAVSVAVDGEVRTMRTPLTYKSRPGALRVFVPNE